MARGDQAMVTSEAPFVHAYDPGLNFIQLPAFRLNEGRDGLSRKKGLRPPSTLGECFEALLRVGVEANGEGCAHL